MDVCTRRERGYSEHHTAASGAEGETESLLNLTVRTLVMDSVTLATGSVSSSQGGIQDKKGF